MHFFVFSFSVCHGLHLNELCVHAIRLSRHLAEGLLEALEEMKPTSVVGLELLDVELGSSAPQILDIKVRTVLFGGLLLVCFSCPPHCLTRETGMAVPD